MLEILSSHGNLLSIKLTRDLDNTDYQKFTDALRHAADKGKVHLLLQFDPGMGRDLHGSWNMLRIDSMVSVKVERVAVVCDPTFANLMEIITKPFTDAQVQSFDLNQLSDAQKWVQEGLQDYED